MKLHLNWDSNNINGICANATYINGALYTGIENRPKLSFEFDSFQYSEEFNQYFLISNGVKTEMTTEQKQEVADIATNWIQPLGQEGNPNLEQTYAAKQREITNDKNTVINGTLAMNVGGQDLVVDVSLDNRSNMHQSYDNAVRAGLPLTDTKNWKMGDNTYKSISYNDMSEIGFNLGVYITDQFGHEEIKYAEIEACMVNPELVTDTAKQTCINAVTW